jgi:hypothetical protein
MIGITQLVKLVAQATQAAPRSPKVGISSLDRRPEIATRIRYGNVRRLNARVAVTPHPSRLPIYPAPAATMSQTKRSRCLPYSGW